MSDEGGCAHEDALAQTVNVALVVHELGLAKRPREVPRTRYPMLLELDYGNQLSSLVHSIRPLYDPIVAQMPSLIAQHAALSGDSLHEDNPLVAKELLEQIRKQATGVLNAGEMAKLARFYGERTSQKQRAELAKQLRAGLGLEVPISESGTNDLITAFTQENAALISTIPEDLHQEVSKLIGQAFRKRMGQETLAELIAERFDVSEGRARFLARDQIGKLNGQLTAARHQALGITHYFWRTMRDDRVRPLHRQREGKRFAYAKPPLRGHPGEDYGCRCGAEPDLRKVLALIAENRRLPGRFSAPLAGTLTGRGRAAR